MHIIRLIFSIVLFLLSLLAYFKAPTNSLWKISILITEYSYIFILISFLLMFFCFRNKIESVSITTLTVAILGFLSPLLRTVPIASKLPQEIIKQFKSVPRHASSRPAPFVLKDYFLGIQSAPVAFKKLIYKYTEHHAPLDLIFYPATAADKKAPCIVVVHGGGWDSGDNQQLPELNTYLASRGFAVAAISYRLAPHYKFPAPIEDTREAIAYLKKESERLNIDSTNFVLLGRSAGGQIALLSAYTLKDPAIRGVISFYAPADMIWGYSIPGNPLIMDSRKVMEQYLGGGIQQVPANYKASSPNEFVNADSPPTLLIHGIRDELVAYEHSKRLHALLDKAGVKNYLLSLPWATHACDYNFHGQSAQLSTFAIERFLASVINQRQDY
jgi:acetyl esterase/lipase